MTVDDPTPLRAAARVLRQLYGIEVPWYRLPLLAAELDELGGRGGHAAGLALLLAREPHAWDRVMDAITVPETYFFRHFGHYLLIRRLAEERAARGRAVRVLCAGCASGEEAWSAAAVLVAARGHAHDRDRVVGWDVSEKRIGEARDARYRDWSVRSGLHGHERFFQRRPDGWEIAPEVRPLVRFAKVNLIDPMPADDGPFDAILFRNVAIYWDAEIARGVVQRLAALLAPDGLLLIGPSDPATLDPSRWQHVISDGVRSFRGVPPTAPAPAAPAPVPALVPAPPALHAFAKVARRAANTADPTPRRETALKLTLRRERSEAQTPIPPPLRAAATLADVKTIADGGRYAAALELLRTTAGNASVEAKLFEGILLLELGDPASAVEIIRQCVYLAPEIASHRRWLAISYRAAGRPEDAEREQRNAEAVGE